MLIFERVIHNSYLSVALVLLLGAGTLPWTSAQAIETHVGVESDFSRSEVQPDVFPFVRAGIVDESKYDPDDDYEHKIDAEFKISPNHPKAYALSSRNFYYGEKDQSTDSPLRFSFGRKLIGWSNVDELWGLGAFEPLDSWDRLRSFTQGLTGIFAYTETANFNFRLFLSYVFLPEITPNVVIDDGKIVSEHPQSIATAPQTINIVGRPTILNYDLVTPPLNTIIFRPSFAVMMETKKELPFFGKFSFGYLPLNYFPVALNASYSIPGVIGTVQLYPRLLDHNLYNWEAGYRIDSSLSFGCTFLIDQPMKDDISNQLTYTPLSTSQTLTPWMKYQLHRSTLILTQLWSKGGLENDVGPLANTSGSSIVSSRILYRNATQFSLRQPLSAAGDPHQPLLQFKFIHEYSIIANWISADFFYTLQPQLNVFFGLDGISAEQNASPDHGAEFLSDLKALDRIRLGASYAF